MRKLDSYKNNLLERLKQFSISIIKLSSKFPKNPAGFTLADQLVRASTSIGSNLVEAQEAVSGKDFLYKVNHALKEAKETYYWLELLNDSLLMPKEELMPLLQETEEIVKILVVTVKKLRTKKIN